MASISIPMSDDEWLQLQSLANRLQVQPEELARAQIRDLLVQEDPDLSRICKDIVGKNKELYRRLAE